MPEKARIGWRDLADARVALMLAFGYSAGLPLLLVFGTLSAWLRESGVPVTTIGLFSWLALAYSFKFLWSPLVDAFDVPVLSRLVGRRRAWMMTSQLVVAIGLVGVAFSDPGSAIAAIVTSGPSRSDRSAYASRSSSGSATPRITPPTSDLCERSGIAVLTATGYPIASAARRASSAERAGRASTTGTS